MLLGERKHNYLNIFLAISRIIYGIYYTYIFTLNNLNYKKFKLLYKMFVKSDNIKF